MRMCQLFSDISLKNLCIEITNKCMLNCIHCSSKASSKSKDMLLFEDIKKILIDAVNEGVENLSISGGEPLIHPEFKEIFSFAKDLGLHITVYSCGIIYNNNKHSSITEDTLIFLKENINKIIISLHGSNDETIQKIVKIKNGFNTIINSIKSCLKYNIETEIHFVPMNINYNEFLDLLDIINDINIKRISLLRLVPQGRCLNNNELEVSVDNMQFLLKEINNKIVNKKYTDLSIRYGCPFNCITDDKNNKPCSVGINKLNISARGDVFPCEAFKWLGDFITPTNILKTNLHDIWVHNELLFFLRTRKIPEICVNKCDKLRRCGGGCVSQFFLYNEQSRNQLINWLNKK